jgi:NAD(P)-dependent dehydrogenase (short-subunit alcohol dehydrogenase family)
MEQAGKAQRLRGKIALVTGAGGTNSIGRSIALRLAHEGAVVGALDISAERAAAVVRDVAASGGRAVALPCALSTCREA